MRRAALLALAAAAVSAGGVAFAKPVTIGSKAFPESWLLGEAMAILARDAGVEAVHRRNLGGTEIAYQALRSGGIDAYPEYTGTIAEVLLPSRDASPSAMRASLAAAGIGISEPLGFNDSYALGVTRATQDRLGLRSISDLLRHPELRFGFTHEFLGRADGFPGLARAYGLTGRAPLGFQHELAYEAIASGKVDVVDVYTTDAQIARLDLRILEDDRGFFPRYDAVLLYRLELERDAPQVLASLRRLTGRIDEAKMIGANARVVLADEPVQVAAEALLRETLGRTSRGVAPTGMAAAIARYTLQHLRLVAISLLAAVLVGIPLGLLAARSRRLGQGTLAVAGLLQTIPSLALLALLVPLLGIGAGPALLTLFLYGLLPIVRNTYTGLMTLPPPLAESARALGLSARSRLLRIELPLASPSIMAGIKTSAVINVGTATLAALIGAGGLGEPILSGIQLRRHALILQGAIPAAVLALLVQWGFDLLDRVVIPKGLRQER